MKFIERLAKRLGDFLTQADRSILEILFEPLFWKIYEWALGRIDQFGLSIAATFVPFAVVAYQSLLGPNAPDYPLLMMWFILSTTFVYGVSKLQGIVRHGRANPLKYSLVAMAGRLAIVAQMILATLLIEPYWLHYANPFWVASMYFAACDNPHRSSVLTAEWCRPSSNTCKNKFFTNFHAAGPIPAACSLACALTEKLRFMVQC